jgi:hypothetical protein
MIGFLNALVYELITSANDVMGNMTAVRLVCTQAIFTAEQHTLQDFILIIFLPIATDVINI